MTKLGLQPGVHGDHEEKEDKEQIKIDPKVFTVLQPTVIPMPVVTEPRKSSMNWSALICKSLIIFCLFTCCCAALLLLLNVSDLFYYSQSVESSQKPQMEALLGSNSNLQKQIDSSVEGKDEIVAIPLARVMVVEDISANPEKKTKIVDGSVEDRSQFQQFQQFQPQQNFEEQGQQERPLHPDEIEMIQSARRIQEQQQMMMFQQMMAMRQWRMRRLQAAIYQQQMMRMAMAQQQQEEMARQWNERAKIEEEARQWEMQQQQQQRSQAYWQQYQAEIQRQQQFQQQQQQQFFPQIMQQFNQEQAQPQVFHQQPQQRPTFWQQPPQHFFFNQKQPVEMNQPAPQPSMHDKIYEELQKKSQNIPVNAPSRQIWTAVTPTPVPEELPTTPSTTSLPVAVPANDEVSDTILRDIFSAFDEQKNSEAANKEIPKVEPEAEIMEGKGAIVIEDSFPKLEERTTIQPENEEESEEVDDHEKENEEFVSVMKFFENTPIRHSSEPSTTTETAPIQVSSTEKPRIILV
ncbi:unnamed protein product [Caenorhabditis angaria]|uniref:Uncharacterized protein n=1 Tax=Caenorhabditis angaria TaxID=860376 RepID=A0A9P1IG60_9PELO|nr:unnamed protein product [Caenorhabditis angaria]